MSLAEKQGEKPQVNAVWIGGTEQHQEGELLTLSELSLELMRRGVIDRRPRTLYAYATGGLKHHGSGEMIQLKTQMFGRTRVSTVSWFMDFLSAHATNG